MGHCIGVCFGHQEGVLDAAGSAGSLVLEASSGALGVRIAVHLVYTHVCILHRQVGW